jgi:hypothetical protein
VGRTSTVLHPTDHKAVEMRALPRHHAWHNTVQLRSRGHTGDLHPVPDRRLTLLQGAFDLLDNWRYGLLCSTHLFASRYVATTLRLGAWDMLFRPRVMVQAAKKRTRPYTALCRPSMSLLLQWSRQRHTRLGNTQGERIMLTRLLILSHSACSAASTTTPHERRRAQVRTPGPGRVSTPMRWGR